MFYLARDVQPMSNEVLRASERLTDPTQLAAALDLDVELLELVELVDEEEGEEFFDSLPPLDGLPSVLEAPALLSVFAADL